MEFEWYWLAEKFGLMQETTQQYADGSIHYEVSVKAEEFFAVLGWSLLPVLFLLGFLISLITTWEKKENAGKTIVRCGIVILLVYALLLAVGIGPYIEFYPRGGGFIDLSVIEHVMEGLYVAVLALCLLVGGYLGKCVGRKRTK